MRKSVLSLLILLLVFSSVPNFVQAKNSLKDIQQERKDIEENVSKVEKEIETLVEELEALNEQISDMEEIIQNNEQALEEVKGNIESVEEEIDVIQKRIDYRMDILKDRAKSYQKQDSNIFLELIFGEENLSFAELISRISLINKIAEADKKIINEQEEDKALVVEKLESLTELEEELTEITESTEEEKKAAELSKKELSEKELALNEKVANLKAEDKKLIEKENKLLLERAEKAAQLSASSAEAKNIGGSNSYAGGKLGWPTVGGYISSGMGKRWGRQHNGVDIARTDYSSVPPILAAESGKVIEAKFTGGFGNTIVIDHGNGLRTRYAHMSSMNVSVGEKVKRGQQIGIMGRTGNSTGIHLHIEVTHNGILQNPLHYFR